jgi:outer membrane autotransporter protein
MPFAQDARPRAIGAGQSSQQTKRDFMNKGIQMTAIAIAMAAASSSVFAADAGAFFINGNVGQSSFHDHGFSDRTDTTEAVRVGYAWNLSPSTATLGVEAGYVDLGRASGTAVTTSGDFDFSTRLGGPLLGVNYKYTLNNKIYFEGRGGWFRSKFDANAPAFGSKSFSGNGTYVGLGVGYDITPHFSLGVNFDEYHGRATVFGVRAKEGVSSLSGFAEYRF